MGDLETSQTANDSNNPENIRNESHAAILHRLSGENNQTDAGSGNPTFAEMLGGNNKIKRLKNKKESVQKNEKTASEDTESIDRSQLPERPSPDDPEQESNEKQEEISESSETGREVRPGDGTEKLGNLSKIIDIEDPVIPDGVEGELGSVDSWFLANVFDDSYGEYAGDTNDDERHDVEIMKKAPDGTVIEHKSVTWDEITPRYDSIEEYKSAFQALREARQQAKTEGNTDYRKHLAKLLQQVSHFAKIFYKKHKSRAETE